MNTPLTELLKISYPIIQGAMNGVGDGTLAAAVSRAGGAGTIPAGGQTVQWVKNEIHIARKKTACPFGVNIILMDENKDAMIHLVGEEQIDYVTLGGGNPIPYFHKLKQTKTKIICIVPNLRLAQKVAEKGADAVIIEGMEAGGHIGNLSTLVLMTQVIPQMNIPVIAAGGFSDGRGLAAALVMGASGIQMGSRFYASIECSAYMNDKRAIVESRDTEMLEKDGHFTRIIKMADSRSKGQISAGQSIVNIDRIQSCEQIIQQMIKDTRMALIKGQKYT